MVKNTQNGTIIKGIGGFYYVETAEGIFECKARGVFRKEKITPMVGDNVVITVNENTDNTIDEIKERRSALLRPPVANIDQLIIVVSCTQPRPNTLLVDRLTAIAVKNNIEPVIVLKKIDLKTKSPHSPAIQVWASPHCSTKSILSSTLRQTRFHKSSAAASTPPGSALS